MTDTSEEMRQATLDLSESMEMSRVARALSVPTRVEILRLLSRENIMSVHEIAKTFSIPASTASVHINVLEEAGLVTCEKMPGIHGVNKMCSKRYRQIRFHLQENAPESMKQLVQNMPIGAYSKAENIAAPCGLASHVGPIGAYNQPICFFLPERLNAQVLWLKSGSLHYVFSSVMDRNAEVESLAFSLEICTQGEIDSTPKTEIHVRINGCDLGAVILNGNPDGKRGLLNPEWWPDVITQHGELSTWKVTRQGSFLHSYYLSGVTLDDLRLQDSEFIDVEIYLPSNGRERYSGLNLFGNRFGNYDQALQLAITYRT